MPLCLEAECVTGPLFFFYRSAEYSWLSRAGEHACPDLHCGQHLCSRRSSGLSHGHSQVEPPHSRPINAQSVTDKKENANWQSRLTTCHKFWLNLFSTFSNSSVSRGGNFKAVIDLNYNSVDRWVCTTQYFLFRMGALFPLFPDLIPWSRPVTSTAA